MRLTILLFVFMAVTLSLPAQTLYTIEIERPDGLNDSEVIGLFGEYPDIRNIQVTGNRLQLTVPDREDYPIRTIRDILAQKGVAAVEFEAAPAGKYGARKKSLETSSFVVYGQCGMCKDRIERAVRSVKGVVMANWDQETHQLTLKYLPERTDLQSIKEAIAAVGHDTDSIRASDEVYQQLHGCCQYDRPKPLKEK